MFRLFFRPRTVWWPTGWGILALSLGLVAPAVVWVLCGEEYLAVSREVPADVLVVEAWIGPNGVEEAAKEFRRRPYRAVVAVAVNEPNGTGFLEHDFAAYASRLLRESGIPAEQVVRVSVPRVKRDRTRTAMAAVGTELAKRGLIPRSLTLFTVGPHTRRSRLYLERTFPTTPVGSIAWFREDPDVAHWWESTDRAKDFYEESLLYWMAVGRF